jgi:hypothetical protein
MENRNGLAVGGMVPQADGSAERRASEAMRKKQAKGSKRITVGEDKAYDTSDHIAALRAIMVTLCGLNAFGPSSTAVQVRRASGDTRAMFPSDRTRSESTAVSEHQSGP